MSDPKIAEIRSWLSKASQDLEASAWLLKSPLALNGVVGYHCQQAAEKTLKAFLTWHEQVFEKTHSLVALVGLCLPISSDFEALRKAATTLTPFAVTTRYPGDLPEVTQQEAQEALELARQVWDFILARLPEETHLPKST